MAAGFWSGAMQIPRYISSRGMYQEPYVLSLLPGVLEKIERTGIIASITPADDDVLPVSLNE